MKAQVSSGQKKEGTFLLLLDSLSLGNQPSQFCNALSVLEWFQANLNVIAQLE